jgi:predicted RNA binding protein YcfA (HicA-like mRNA interferase family)
MTPHPKLDWPHSEMKFRDLIRILLRHGFELARPPSGSHRVYKGRVGGRTRLVVVAYHSGNDDVKPGTLASMIGSPDFPKAHSVDESLKQPKAS